MTVSTHSFRSINEATNERYAQIITASIAEAGTQSGAADLHGLAPIRLIMPSAWKSTAAIVKFNVSDDGENYYPFWSAGTAVTVAVKKSQAVRVDPELFWGVGYIKLTGTQAKGTAVTHPAVDIKIMARLI